MIQTNLKLNIPIKIALKNNYFALLPFILLLILSLLLNCNKEEKSIRLGLEGEYKIKILKEFSEPSLNCDLYKEKAHVPLSLNTIHNFSEKEYFEYCIPFTLNDLQIFYAEELGIFLGFIDNYYRIYLNGKLIASTEKDEKIGNLLIYDRANIIKLQNGLLKRKNVLNIQIRKILHSRNGGGIFSGIIKIDFISKIIWENNVSKIYNFGKSVLFYSTAFLFIILFLGKKNNYEFLWFGLFLFVMATYQTTILELKYDLGFPLEFTKKVEYTSLTLILPTFNTFFYSILYKKIFKFPVIFVWVFSLGFLAMFAIIGDVLVVDKLNFNYHIPFLFAILCLLFLVPLREVFFKKNKRAIPVLIILFLPAVITILQLTNTIANILPSIHNVNLFGDSVLIFVATMALYTGYQFYHMQIILDNSIHKEEILRKTFQLYVPPRDIEKILNNFDQNEEMLNVGIEEEKIILFCDIRNFTNMSEKMTPTEVVGFLNTYFKRFNRIIIENGGIIDKLIGDCIMARFDSGKEFEAISASLEMEDALQSFNRYIRRYQPLTIKHGIGISMGNVIEGNIGSINKMDYTVIGDSVNTASRLESLTKFYNTPILVTENLALKTSARVIYREIDTIIIKGKAQSVKIFEPLGWKDNGNG